MDVGGWLRSLGLEQYEAAFRKNEINDTLLPSLTADDLKDLGVVIVGHRRTLLNAIAALRTDANAKTAPADALPTLDTSPKDTAERRQVTVMFSDLVGSTALSACMDPEDLREVVSAYQKCVAESVRRYGGFVAKYMGDGVLIYFGYPQAHEDDAERAVRAGLEVVTAVAGLKAPVSLQTRNRHCDRVGGYRRPDRVRRFTGTGHRWRRRVLSAMTTVFGSAIPCRPAARLGVYGYSASYLSSRTSGRKNLKASTGRWASLLQHGRVP
jgi:hypothetical protein